MKKNISLIPMLLLLHFNSFSQNALDGLYARADMEQMADIDKSCKEIKADLNSYQKKTIVKDSVTTIVYSAKHQPVYAEGIFSAKNSSNKREYYFKNAELIYIQQEHKNSADHHIIATDKFYFEKQHLFAWFESDVAVNPNSEKFKSMATATPQYIAELKTLIK